MNNLSKNKITDKITQLMRQENLSALSIKVFLHHYAKIIAGESGIIHECDIQPINHIIATESLPDFSTQGKAVLGQTVMIKLNGGLGTGMGLEKAKSLLVAKDKLRFLDIIIKQVILQRAHFNSDLPLLFMNSRHTEADTQAVLNKYPALKQGQQGIPFSVMQNKVPRILATTKTPAIWHKDPAKTWCPPGHGDIYTVLQTSGLLNQLLEQGVKYAFIANADNLGATMDLSLLGYFAEQNSTLMMEVTQRTAADKKGGHLAQSSNGNLLLRELNQCHVDDLQHFQDISRYKYFNTNNLWLRLDRLKTQLEDSGGMLDLPVIQNHKPIDTRDATSPQVIQLETAMGAAICNFKDAIAVRTAKARFIPIKTSNELLGLWSNAFVLDDNHRILANPQRTANHLVIHLDPQYFKNIDDLQARFPSGAPDLVECEQLTVIGDVKFSQSVKIIGRVTLKNTHAKQLVIAANTVLSG